MTTSQDRPWTVRFAPHLSFGNLEEPYFRSLAETAEPVEQIRLAAEHGFGTVFDLMFLNRPPEAQARIGEALGRFGVALNTITGGPQMQPALWLSTDADDRARLARAVELALDAARRVGAAQVLVSCLRDRLTPVGEQIYAFGENLRRVVPLAERAGLTLCVEAASPARLPDGLLHRLVDAYTVVRLAESAAVKLVFDTYHQALTEGDQIGNLRWAADRIGSIQLAAAPGRFEPGSGEHDFARIIAAALDAGFQGVFELEHFFSQPGRAGVELALSRLRAIDEAVASRAR